MDTNTAAVTFMYKKKPFYNHRNNIQDHTFPICCFLLNPHIIVNIHLQYCPVFTLAVPLLLCLCLPIGQARLCQ